MFGDAEAVSHLLERGLFPATAGHSARVRVGRLPGRNFLYRIEFDGGAPLLLKRAVDAETRRGLEREAAAYDALAGSPGPGPSFVPRKLDYDSGSSTLVLEFFPQHRSLDAEQGGGVELDAGLAGELGRILARLHRLAPPAGDSTPPWIVTLVHPPLGILREATQGHLDLIRHVQRSTTWSEALKKLADEWEPRAFVHGDLRFSNILSPDPRHDGSALALIDWELSGPGDPAWDIGWVIAGILARRAHDLSAAFPLVRACWVGYTEGAGDTSTRVLLERTIRWSAAAALQLAHEEARMPRPDDTLAAMLIEVGRSLLERTAVWIERVFWEDPG